MYKKGKKAEGKKVVCAMSGGVDSSVSAALLRAEGWDVTGVFMKCRDEDGSTGMEKRINTNTPCTAEEDERYARRAAARIGIPFYSVDLVREYKQKVVDYFVSEYEAGRTPNPDVMCNREIKFGVFYDWAMNEFGAEYIATGHYARVELGGRVLKGIDPGKDQSYFLWAVEREKLKNVLFPIGGYKKSKVRELARKFDLPNASRRDSQGICFIGKVNVANFLHGYIEDKPGAIVNTRGENVGEHAGLHFYTLGQRRGINIGGGPPYFVAQKKYGTNTLVVAREYDKELFEKILAASNLNWIAEQPKLPFACTAKIRYRQADQDAIIKGKDEGGNLIVEFEKPQRAVTPGQSIVFYKKDELLGGGIIK